MKNLFIIISLLLSSTAWPAKTIKVGKQQAFSSVTAALAAANAGDTILVYPGTYREGNIVITKPVYLKGIQYPVIDGAHRYEALSIRANNVTVEGLKVVNTGNSSIDDLAGIKLYGVNNAVIRNNILDNTVFGIYSYQSYNSLIEKNHITSYGTVEQQSGNGIHCWKSDSMRIIGNVITGHRDGIYFEFVTNSVIWRNISQKNIRYGLHFMFSNNDSYITNIFKNNGAGVAVMYSYHVKMLHNFFTDNWGDAAYGLLLKEIRDSHIEGNYFERNTCGIYMEAASRINLRRNTFRRNGWGMKMQANCMDLEVTASNFMSNTFDVATNGSLVLNKFNGNYWDKYEGYDLNKDKIGDVPYRPVSMYSMIVEQTPAAMVLFRSFITTLLDKTEKVLPSITPENLKDETPFMKPLNL
ncbi:MAG TPA: nitrous oxide reductase family maturation protein NosD [Chitinophagaceae bacterium]